MGFKWRQVIGCDHPWRQDEAKGEEVEEEEEEEPLYAVNSAKKVVNYFVLGERASRQR